MSPLLLRRMTDENLGRRLAAGEAAAFDELYRRYVHRLAAYGSHLLGDAVSGDDVAQAALLKAYGSLRDGRVPDRMRPWLYRIAHNVAIDLVTRRRELPSPELPERAGEETNGDGSLVTALAALPDRQRRVYVLREIHGLRIDETAAELGLTAQQVEQALFAARNRLAELLVFGERLSCVSVQRLVSGPLDVSERRALKTHLRSCATCRTAVGRSRSLTVWPFPSLEWLRLLPGLGAPATAKIGAAVATATVAAGTSMPFVINDTHRPAVAPMTTSRPAPARAVVTTVRVPPHDAVLVDATRVTTPESHVPVRTHGRRHSGRGRGEHAGEGRRGHAGEIRHEPRGREEEPVDHPQLRQPSRHSGERHGAGHGTSAPAVAAPATPTTTATTTTATPASRVDSSGPGPGPAPAPATSNRGPGSSSSGHGDGGRVTTATVTTTSGDGGPGPSGGDVATTTSSRSGPGDGSAQPSADNSGPGSGGSGTVTTPDGSGGSDSSGSGDGSSGSGSGDGGGGGSGSD